MGRILQAIKNHLPIRSLVRRDMSDEKGTTIENVDAQAQYMSMDMFPPDYVKDDDPPPRR